MNDGKGSVLGCMLLIAGSCIGAGMLGLPIVTGLAGFFPSLLMFFLAWLFMTSTALLLVEANGWFSHQVNLLTMVNHALGKWGKGLCWITYLFLFYAILVAYISGIGSLCETFFKIPDWVGSVVFVVLFGWMIYLGTRKVDLFNRGLMFFKIGFFVLLVILGARYIYPEYLMRTEAIHAPSALPLLVIAFGFHNMIPSLTAYLKGDLKRVRMTIIGGSLMAFVIYLIWEVLVLGIVPLSGITEALKLDHEASQALAAVIQSKWVNLFAQGMAFFALLTSFLAQGLSLVHFLADGLKVPDKSEQNFGLCTLALLPPLVLSLIYPQLFFKALNFAGGICAVILFGLLPVAMIWRGRYRLLMPGAHQLRGGKIALALIFCFALFIFSMQLSKMICSS
jgi:tyrosine-specific transport protein